MYNEYNCIPKDYHEYLKSRILSPEFPWSFWPKAIPDCLKATNKVDTNKFVNPTQLKHVFLNKTTKTKEYSLIQPLIDFYAKATNSEIVTTHAAAVIMQHPVKDLKYITPHVDFDHKNHKDTELVTIVYYLTQADGGTYLYNEFCSSEITKSVSMWKYSPTEEGKLIEFNSNRFHSGVEPTDNIRVVITVIMEIRRADIR